MLIDMATVIMISLRAFNVMVLAKSTFLTIHCMMVSKRYHNSSAISFEYESQVDDANDRCAVVD